MRQARVGVYFRRRPGAAEQVVHEKRTVAEGVEAADLEVGGREVGVVFVQQGRVEGRGAVGLV